MLKLKLNESFKAKLVEFLLQNFTAYSQELEQDLDDSLRFVIDDQTGPVYKYTIHSYFSLSGVEKTLSFRFSEAFEKERVVDHYLNFVRSNHSQEYAFKTVLINNPHLTRAQFNKALADYL